MSPAIYTFTKQYPTLQRTQKSGMVVVLLANRKDFSLKNKTPTPLTGWGWSPLEAENMFQCLQNVLHFKFINFSMCSLVILLIYIDLLAPSVFSQDALLFRCILWFCLYLVAPSVFSQDALLFRCILWFCFPLVFVLCVFACACACVCDYLIRGPSDKKQKSLRTRGGGAGICFLNLRLKWCNLAPTWT